jgi:hypothetical protein
MRALQLLPDGEMLLPESGDSPPPAQSPRPVARVWRGEARAGEVELRKRERRYRTQEASLFTAGFLIVLGLAGIVGGTHDAIVVPTLGGRLTGTLLATAGLVTAFGGASLLVLAWEDARYVPAFVGAIVAALTLVMLMVAALLGSAPLPAIAVTFYVAFFCFLICAQLARPGFPVVARYMRKRGLKRLGSLALGGGAVLVVGQFLYESLYVPSNATPSITVKTSLTKGRPVGGMIPLTAKIQLKNPTEQEVHILGSLYQVRTAKVERATPPPEEKPPSDAVARRWQRALVHKSRVRSNARERLTTVVERGQAVAVGTFLEPDAELDRELVVLAPRGSDLARLSVRLVVARRRFRAVKPKQLKFVQTGNTRVIVEVDAIDDPSWIHEVTRSQRYVHVVSSFETSHLPGCSRSFLISYIDNSNKPRYKGACRRGARHMLEYYGITYADATAEVQLAH